MPRYWKGVGFERERERERERKRERERERKAVDFPGYRTFISSTCIPAAPSFTLSLRKCVIIISFHKLS